MMKLPEVLLELPSWWVKIDWLALSRRTSGIKVSPFTLRLAERVVAQMLDAAGSLTPSWSLKYSVRRVRPSQGLGSRFRYRADPHQVREFEYFSTARLDLFREPLRAMLKREPVLAVTTTSY